MKAAANAVIPSHIGVHPLAAKSSVAKVVIAPNPRLLMVSPRQRNGSKRCRQARLRPQKRCDRTKLEHQRQYPERPQRGGQTDREEPVRGIECSFGRGADGKRRVERRPEPG